MGQKWKDWLLGDSNDALNAPFALFIYRYSTPGEAPLADVKLGWNGSYLHGKIVPKPMHLHRFIRYSIHVETYLQGLKRLESFFLQDACWGGSTWQEEDPEIFEDEGAVLRTHRQTVAFWLRDSRTEPTTWVSANHRVQPYLANINHPFWGTPISGNLHMEDPWIPCTLQGNPPKTDGLLLSGYKSSMRGQISSNFTIGFWWILEGFPTFSDQLPWKSPWSPPKSSEIRSSVCRTRPRWICPWKRRRRWTPRF